MSPIISIVIPVYNKSEYLVQTIESILKSDYSHFEIVVVDDGSKDDLEPVISELLKKDKRIIFHRQENAGVCVARNRGIAMARGKFILPLDADDLIGKQYLSKAVKILEDRPEVSLVYPKAVKFRDGGIIHKPWFLGHYDFQSFLGMCVIPPCGMFRKIDFEKFGGYDVEMKHGVEDWEFWINLLNHSNGEVVQLDYAGYKHRACANNSRHTAFNANKDNALKTYNYVYNKHIKLYRTHYGDLPMSAIMQQSYYKYKVDRLEYLLKQLHPKNMIRLILQTLNLAD